MEDEKKILEDLRNAVKNVNEDMIKEASTEQLLEYLDLTNKIKAMIMATLEAGKE